MHSNEAAMPFSKVSAAFFVLETILWIAKIDRSRIIDNENHYRSWREIV